MRAGQDRIVKHAATAVAFNCIGKERAVLKSQRQKLITASRLTMKRTKWDIVESGD